MTPLIALLLDVVMIVLLVLMIVSAWRLSARLNDFRVARREFESVIARFDSATQRAEGGIRALDAASGKAGEELQAQVTRARGLRDELKMMNEAAESVARRLESAVPGRASEPLAAKPAPGPGEVRSKAERDLLKAMEGKRNS